MTEIKKKNYLDGLKNPTDKKRGKSQWSWIKMNKHYPVWTTERTKRKEKKIMETQRSVKYYLKYLIHVIRILKGKENEYGI